jgi:hypothetical protein
MLRREDLEAKFAGVTDVGPGVVRFKDALPKVTWFYYVRPGQDADLLLVSEGNPDDAFALAVLSPLDGVAAGAEPALRPLGANSYGFDQLLLVPPSYHTFFRGRLDDHRPRLVLCVPIHRGEFSGRESAAEYDTLRKEVVPIASWTRTAAPKTVLRFENPQTRSGTGQGYVLVKVPLVLREIDSLEGVAKGFIELLNYQEQVIEVLSPRPGVFTLIRDRDDATRTEMGKAEVVQAVKDFLGG